MVYFHCLIRQREYIDCSPTNQDIYAAPQALFSAFGVPDNPFGAICFCRSLRQYGFQLIIRRNYQYESDGSGVFSQDFLTVLKAKTTRADAAKINCKIFSKIWSNLLADADVYYMYM